MTDTEKELLQAKHRLEEAQARDRVKERKARTHRLIQIGAIFVKACPELAYMDLKELEKRLCEAMEKEYREKRPGQPGRFSFSRVLLIKIKQEN